MKRFWSRWLSRLLGQETKNNEMYGHAKMLRRYCGLKLPLPAQCLIQHGWSFGPGIELLNPEKGFLPKDSRFVLWNSRNEQICHDLGYYNVRVIGAPLLYLPPPVEFSTGEPKSLLLFPSHSANSEPFAEDGARLFSRYIDELQPVTNSFRSTTICLYWREFDDARIRRQLEDRGLNTVTLGHRDQTPNFLASFVDLVHRHEYVSTNEYSTALFYSLFLGRKAFVRGSTFVNRLKPGKTDSLTQYSIMNSRYPQLDWEKFNDRSHQEIGADEIGALYRLPPDELRVVLGWRPSRQLISIGRRVGGYARRKMRSTRR